MAKSKDETRVIKRKPKEVDVSKMTIPQAVKHFKDLMYFVRADIRDAAARGERAEKVEKMLTDALKDGSIVKTKTGIERFINKALYA